MTVDSSYIADVAVPMLFIGLGQGLAFSPLTSYGIGGVPSHLAGAASGLLNTAHQLGTCLGLAVVVTASASLGSDADTLPALAERVRIAISGAGIMLALATLVVVAVIIPAVAANSRGSAQPADRCPS